ncbi:glycosyltransferase family 25 protein [Consotaella aegiceratis]|uniref:glycosyltransferase family 25 protein n=1 Tax=Consotaella aegiceratis TaxID=3097961 RepID=UPI002F409181
MQAVYINLDRAGERRAFMEAQGRRLGLDLERHRATEAADIPEDEFQRLSRLWERPLTRNELAAFLSHRAVWRRAAGSAEGLVVLEDDAVLSARFGAIIERLPSDGFDLVNLENFERRKFFRRAPALVEADFRLTEVVRDKAGAAAYHLSRRGAERLLALAEARTAPADAFLFAVARLRLAQAEPAPAMQAHLLAQRGVEPGIATQTQIHQPRQRLSLTPATLPYHWRRLRTQIDLVPAQVRRLVDLDFRAPEVDLEDFRRVLPMRL